MGPSEKLYHLPLPSGAEPAAVDVPLAVDLRDGRAGGFMENTSATTFAGRVVGDRDSMAASELLDTEL
jgi:hypothetical protein